MATFVLVAEANQGEVTTGPLAVPAVAGATTVQIKLVSSVFGSDDTLSFRVVVEESLDGGATWRPASGFPSSAVGGFAGQVTRFGVSDGLLSVRYFYDGVPKSLRATGTPLVGGTPGPAVDGILVGSVPGSFDWGLTATVV